MMVSAVCRAIDITILYHYRDYAAAGVRDRRFHAMPRALSSREVDIEKLSPNTGPQRCLTMMADDAKYYDSLLRLPRFT